MAHDNGEIDPSVRPSGVGCKECLATEGWWLHLRRCAKCGHIGCCDRLAKSARQGTLWQHEAFRRGELRTQ